MDILGLVWVPDILLWALLLAVTLYLYGTWTHSTLKLHGYNGPPPKPFLGNNDLSFEKGHVGAYDLTMKQQYGKTFALYEGRQPVVMSFDTEFLKDVTVKEFASFTDRRDLYLRGKMKTSLLDLRGPEWKRVRSMTTPFFTTGKLKNNTEHLEFCVNNLKNKCDKFAKTGEDTNVKELMAAFSLEAICLTAFGLQIDSQDDPDHPLLQACKNMVQDIEPGNMAFKLAFIFPFMLSALDMLGVDMWPKGTIETFTKFTRIAITERQISKQERPDFIQSMIQAHEEEIHHEKQNDVSGENRGKALTEDEIVAQVTLFALAGYDTVSTTAMFLLFNLANNPEYQEKVLAEIQQVIGNDKVTYENLKKMSYLDMCMEESMRLYPSLFRLDRKCTQSTTIKGHHIPKDTLVMIPVFGIHHDPEYWPNPNQFDPERFSPENHKNVDQYAYYAFGMGPRNCVGMRLAQIEVKMAVIKVIQNFKVTVSKRTKMPLQLAVTFFIKVVGDIWLNFEKR